MHEQKALEMATEVKTLLDLYASFVSEFKTVHNVFRDSSIHAVHSVLQCVSIGKYTLPAKTFHRFIQFHSRRTGKRLVGTDSSEERAARTRMANSSPR